MVLLVSSNVGVLWHTLTLCVVIVYLEDLFNYCVLCVEYCVRGRVFTVAVLR